jgi:hypothetical protein
VRRHRRGHHRGRQRTQSDNADRRQAAGTMTCNFFRFNT